MVLGFSLTSISEHLGQIIYCAKCEIGTLGETVTMWPCNSFSVLLCSTS